MQDAQRPATAFVLLTSCAFQPPKCTDRVNKHGNVLGNNLDYGLPDWCLGCQIGVEFFTWLYDSPPTVDILKLSIGTHCFVLRMFLSIDVTLSCFGPP